MEIKEYINEVWKPVRGFVGLYEVSNFGRVRSVDRCVIFNDGRKRIFKGRIIKPAIRQGYFFLHLSKGCKATNFQVHRLVMEAFVPNPHNYPCINHKDENKLNNYIHVNDDGTIDPDKSNLEWCTVKYNTNYGTGKERRAMSQSKPVLQHTLNWAFIKRWAGGQSEAARELNLSQTHIGACCLGKRKSHGGYRWTFEN